MKIQDTELGRIFEARLARIEFLENEVRRLAATVQVLEEERDKSRGDGYTCMNTCAHCCSQHTCENC